MDEEAMTADEQSHASFGDVVDAFEKHRERLAVEHEALLAENQRLRDALERLVAANDEDEDAICDLISASPPDGAEARQVVTAAELVEAFKAARAALAGGAQ